jgi:hypothetical protein
MVPLFAVLTPRADNFCPLMNRLKAGWARIGNSWWPKNTRCGTITDSEFQI